MKAIILTAGIGSRIRPLTDTTPKCLLKVAGKTILERMIENLQQVNVSQFIIVTGYMADVVKEYIQQRFPGLLVTFVHNERYLETNTGYSLLLTREYVRNDAFVKLDGDVVFEMAVVEKLCASPYPNCLCIDKNIHLDKEEVKVILKDNTQVLKVGKKLNPHESHGESIGIEKLSLEGGKEFFNVLKESIIKKQHLKEYYDDSYTTLVQKGIPFYSVDISNFKWVEIDTHEDYQRAQQLFKEE